MSIGTNAKRKEPRGGVPTAIRELAKAHGMTVDKGSAQAREGAAVTLHVRFPMACLGDTDMLMTEHRALYELQWRP